VHGRAGHAVGACMGQTRSRLATVPAQTGRRRQQCVYRRGKIERISRVMKTVEEGGQRIAKLSQVAPVVEFVGVLGPAVTDVGAVVHVGDKDIFNAGINLGLSLLHGLAGADYG
jgi:hypothetical protein